MTRKSWCAGPMSWFNIFGGAGAAPVPKDEPKEEPKEEHKSEEERMEEALHRDAQRKCAGMKMTNHITAWNALKGLDGEHRATLEKQGYSASVAYLPR